MSSLIFRNLAHFSEDISALLRKKLWAKILLGMVLGVIVGIVVGTNTSKEVSTTVGEWIALPGNLFLTIVQMVVVPLIFSSVIRGIAAGKDVARLKKMGALLVPYFLTTTSIALLLGISITHLIEPGKYVQVDLSEAEISESVETTSEFSLDSFPEKLLQVLPQNPLLEMIEGQMLQIVLFAILFGIALMSIPPKQAKPFLEFLGSIQSVCLLIVRWAMALAPYAVFGLLAKVVMQTGISSLFGMGAYVGTVILGLLSLLLVYAIILLFLGESPFSFFQKIREVQLLAFSTSSSAAVMPLSIKTAQEKLSIRPSTAQFMVPLGATVNMDGTALYQGAATLFLAQIFGIDLSISQLLLVVITAVGASIGTPATPGVGIIVLAVILESAGIPAAGIAILIGVDRILDMCRTSVNVTGDLLSCVVMDRFVGAKVSSKKEMKQYEKTEAYLKEKGVDTAIQKNHILSSISIFEDAKDWVKGLFRNKKE